MNVVWAIASLPFWALAVYQVHGAFIAERAGTSSAQREKVVLRLVGAGACAYLAAKIAV